MADQRSTIEDHVTCCICMDLYEDPIALPCMHSFCRKCLLGVHSSSLVVKCPECRTDTKLGRQGIDGLPRNFQLGCIVESYRKDHRILTPKLPVCSEHGFKCELLCETCKRSICISCLQNDYHTNHRITITDEDKLGEYATLCDKHQRDIVWYCRDCAIVLCLECITTTHRSHCLQTIDEAYIKSSQIMEDTVSSIESRRLLLKATQKSCKTMTQKLQMDFQRKRQDLSVYFDRLRDSLDKRESSLRRELETRQKATVEVYLSKAEQALSKEAKVVELINDVRRLLTADKQRFLQKQRTTTERVEELLDNEYNDVMPRVPGLDHVMLQTASLDEQLTNITWEWPDQDTKAVRKAPPIPAQRKSKPRTEHSDQLNGLKQGSPVQRGPHWKDAMRDGGPGHYGTVIHTTVDPTVYLVRWPNGNSGEYKYIPRIVEEIVPPKKNHRLNLGVPDLYKTRQMVDQRSTIEGHVTCCICMDLYEDPIALPCMHSFCRKCLLGVHSSSLVVKCPECRTDTKLGIQGIDGLPRNFQLGCIVESYRKDHRIPTPKLPVCSEHGSKCQLLCETCKQSICISCLQNDFHANHRITITDEDKFREDATLCDKHQRDIVSYCRDCVIVLCLECIITTHRNHCLQNVDEAYFKFSQIMEDTASNLESRILLLKATQKSCKTMTQKLQMDFQRKNQELSVYFDRLRDSLDKRESALIRELETRQKSTVEAYLSKAEQASKKESSVVELMNDVKRLLTADKERFLQKQKTTPKRVEELLDNEYNDVMPSVPGIDHVMLQTTSLDEQLTNITWKWPDLNNKSARKAPPIPAQRKSKPRTEHSDQLNGLKQGSPVQRGPHWKDAMRDGGPGHYGTVIQPTVDPTVYLVRWPNGNSGEYKYVPRIVEEIMPP